MKNDTARVSANVLPFPSILPFPAASNTPVGRALRRDLLNTLRASRSAVIVDLSDRATLNHDDIGLLLECVAEVAGRDTQLLFVAGSRVNRVILEVTRISSLVPVFNSAKEAMAYQNSPEEVLAYPQIAAERLADKQRWSA
jgi:hypothetical protein